MKRLCATLLFALWSLCALAALPKSGTVVYIDGAKYYVHTVQPGETLYGLSKQYEVSEQVILQNNPALAAEGLKAGENIKIPFVAEVSAQPSEKKLRKTFDFHFVEKGETLYALARRYEIPIRTLIDDNPGLDPTRLRLGERILVRKKQIGSADEPQRAAQWEEYRDRLNSVSDGYAYHIVHAGETFYSLSRRFGITEDELAALNGGLQAADLKAGAMIRVPEQSGYVADTSLPHPDSLSMTPDSVSHGRGPEIDFRALRRSDPLRIALLLPLSVDGQPNANYLEFYQGFLLGLDSVKNRYGYSIDLDLFNTARSPERIAEIMAEQEFRQANLIVGPVYEDVLYPVVRFAEEQRIPVVSPLAHVTRLNSDVLFQLAPDPATKWEKVGELVNGDRKVTLIRTETTDREFEQEILSLLTNVDYELYQYKYEHPSNRSENSPSDLTPLLDNGEDNLFVILSDNEVDIDRILAAIASADTSLRARGRTTPRFTVLGNARWNRYNSLDRAMFFQDRVVLVSTYHAKRDAQTVVDFDSAYIRSFGSLPSLFSYRGYDTAMIFAPAMYDDIESDLEQRTYTPLQTTYRFRRDDAGRNHVNRSWTRVDYNPDFTITIR